MKLTTVLLMATFLQVSASGYAQITLLKKNVSLEEVFKEIKAQTKYHILYSPQALEKAHLVNISVQNGSVEEVLKQSFQNQPLTYAIQNLTIVVREKRQPGNTFLQAVPVRGKVVDDQGAPLVGVTVKVKGTNVGTTTNVSGDFSINAPDNSILVFTYLGFSDQEISATTIFLTVVLKEKITDLEQVVVIGYGTVVKPDLTGSVGMVDIKDMENAPVASFEQALAGRVAGVQVFSEEGQPGREGMNIVIRGSGSLTQSNAPLYVVDGFPIEDFDAGTLNTDDIESINVLKDASATAIYGARGANGVIIVETKKGQIGTPVVSYNGSVGFQQILKRMEVMSPYEFVRYQVDLGNGASYLSGGRTVEDYRNVEGVNWQDQLFRTGKTNIHNIALRGGSPSTRYSISASMYDGEGVIISTGNNRYQGRFSLDHNFNKKLQVGTNINYSSQTGFGRRASTGAASHTTLLLYATLAYRPVTGRIDYSQDDLVDDIIDDDINTLQDYRTNPIISTQNEYNKSISDNLIANGFLKYEIIKGLTFKTTAGINSNSGLSEYFYNSKTSRGTPALPTNGRGQWGGRTNSKRIALSNENTLTYKKKINSHSFDILGGFSVQESRTQSNGFIATQVPNESLGVNGLGEGLPFTNSTRASVFTLQSYLTRANYNFNSKYLFTATLRADGSSKFSKENRWGYFPSAALAWRMNKEPFMKSLDFVSDSKLRLSYGLTGNNRVSDFATLPLIGYNIYHSYSFGNELPTSGALIESLGNADLKWETTKQIDLGYDLGLFRNKVELTLDVYRKTTEDLLLNASMPTHTGFTRVYKNIGSVQNQGLEVTLNTVNIHKKDFSWETNFNISFNRNKILGLTKGEDNFFSAVAWDNNYANTNLYIAKVGQPVGQMYGYVWDGVYQLEDFDEQRAGVYTLKNTVTTNNTSRTSTVRPGDIKYKDLNGDLVINELDQTNIGSGLPLHIGGISNRFTYKGLGLGVFFQWSYGNDVFNANRMTFEGSATANRNQFASYVNRWTPENPSNEYFRAEGAGPGGLYSSRTVEDGSFLRLKTISLDYSIPKNLIRGVKVNNIRLHASAQNLLVWSDYSGYDPEVSSKHSTLTPSFDYSSYPQARTIVFGVKASL
ncbi:MAG TPA: TonB-dependent receptor [Sphingobacteriaceae bacterium]